MAIIVTRYVHRFTRACINEVQVMKSLYQAFGGIPLIGFRHALDLAQA